MSSAQAAASAAFSASKASATGPPRKQKPALWLNTDIKNAPPKLDTPRPAGYSRASTPRANDGREIPTPGNTRRQHKKSSTNASRTTPNAGGSFSNRNGAQMRRSSRTSPGSIGLWSSRSSRGSRASADMGADPVIPSQAGFDYFSLPRSTSVPPTDPNRSTPTLQAPASTNPYDMLASVRQSINSKAKVGTSKEAVRKSQLALHEFRSSVDHRRLVSQAASYMGSSHEDIHTRQPVSNSSSRQSSEGNVYDNLRSNRSHSSVGSVISDTHSNDGASLLTPNFKFSYVSDAASTDAPKKSSPDPHDAPSPIPIPLSSQGVDRGLDRGLAATASNGLAKLSLSTETLATSSSDALVEPTVKPTKPGRKKPPSSNDSGSFCETSGSDLEYGVAGPGQSDPEVDETESIKFPLFPGISEKSHHRIGLFSKKRKKARDSGVVYDPESEPADENDVSLAPAISRAGKNFGRNVQPVKLRTTMRKEDKRKEKKTAFNEDKPWKNHGDLDAISDPQRKRYEGLWVSNKGLYLDHVVAKLTGVNYEGNIRASTPNARDLSESDVSEKAAKLSANLNVDPSQPDLKELHSLENATTDNLMHASVVRKLWNRSNLPRETLSMIWDLVDYRKDSTLSKAEFIVGMWLVDQCLYGRKLPKVVNKSVWSSLGGLGVNVVVKKKRR